MRYSTLRYRDFSGVTKLEQKRARKGAEGNGGIGEKGILAFPFTLFAFSPIHLWLRSIAEQRQRVHRATGLIDTEVKMRRRARSIAGCAHVAE